MSENTQSDLAAAWIGKMSRAIHAADCDGPCEHDEEAKRWYKGDATIALAAIWTDIERLQSQVPPEGSLVLQPSDDVSKSVSPGDRFVFGEELKMVTGNEQPRDLGKFFKDTTFAWVEWKP
jgi:hypothetical protein